MRVVALPGASSISLAVAASGLNGQSFAFVGYLPVGGRSARRAHPRAGGGVAPRLAQTQLMIETPYRNAALLDALLAHLQPATMLSVSVGLTLAGGADAQRRGAARGARAPTPLPADVPAVFSLPRRAERPRQELSAGSGDLAAEQGRDLLLRLDVGRQAARDRRAAALSQAGSRRLAAGS